jgi:hypothetical protein
VTRSALDGQHGDLIIHSAGEDEAPDHRFSGGFSWTSCC